MSCQNEKYLLRLAVQEDGPEILAVLEEIDFQGNISLLYTRRPDAYKSLESEGEEVLILICQDTQNSRIIGVGACAIRCLYVNGRTERVGYLMGLRLKKEYRNNCQLLARAYAFLYAHLRDKGIKYFITTILEDNKYAQRLLEKRRKIMPYYEPFGSYEVFTIKTRKQSGRNAELFFKKADKSDGPGIINFLQMQGRTMQFFPAVNESDFAENRFPGLSWEDFYILSDQEGEILAAGAAWVQKSYKQYVVQGYSGVLKYFYPFSFLLSLFGYPVLPKVGSVLDFFTLSFWAVKENNAHLFKTFIENIAGSLQKYPFFLIGVHQHHPLREELTKMRHIRYASKVYLVNWEKKTGLLEDLNAEPIPYLECGTL